MSPGDWSDPMPGRPIPLLRAIRDDLHAHIPPGGSRPSKAGRFFQRLAIVARSSGFHATATHRIAHTLRSRWGRPGRLLSAFLFWWGRHFYGCSIAPTARLHGGVILPHPQGIVIGGGAEVGPRAWIFQNVTFGGAPEKAGMPRIGADARIYAGAVIVGPIRVGDNVVIGANAVVHRDLDSNTIARAPAAEIAPLAGRSLDRADLPGSGPERP